MLRYVLYLLLICFPLAGYSQRIESIGLGAGIVNGVNYTYQYNKYSLHLNMGWVGGVNSGGYTSIMGSYKVFTLLDNAEIDGIKILQGGIKVDFGLGIYGMPVQPSTDKIREQEKTIGYIAPLGGLFMGKVYFDIAYRLCFGMLIAASITDSEYSQTIAQMQILLQYKLHRK